MGRMSSGRCQSCCRGCDCHLCTSNPRTPVPPGSPSPVGLTSGVGSIDYSLTWPWVT